MKTYYIYHIQGKKIGCTDDIKRRMKAQKCKDYEIIEVHTDEDVASDREIELQKQYGYRVDRVKYNEVDRIESGKKAGKIAVESGQLLSAAINGGKTQGRKNVESGKLKNAQIAGGKVKNRKKTSISAYHKDTGDYIGTYNSIRKCANYLHINHSHIVNCLNGKQNSSKGYTFKKEIK
jgi:hypothetical protein